MYLYQFDRQMRDDLSDPYAVTPFLRRHEEEKQEESLSWSESLDAAWTGVVHGVTNLTPERFYRAIRSVGNVTGSTSLVDWATRNIEEEMAARERDPWYRPDPKWMESEWGRALYEGCANFSAGLGAMAPGAVLAPFTGGLSLGAALLGGAASGGALAGLSEFDQFLDEAYVQMQAADPSVARDMVYSEHFWGALASGVAEGGMSFGSDLIGGKLAGLIGKPAAKAASSLLTKTIKNLTSHMAVEIGEEAATAYVQDWAREVSGLDHQGRWNAIKQIIGPTLVTGALGGVQNTVLKTGKEILSSTSPESDAAALEMMQRHDEAKRRAALSEPAHSFMQHLAAGGNAPDAAFNAALIADAKAKRWAEHNTQSPDAWFANVEMLQKQGQDAGLSQLTSLALAVADPSHSFDNVVDQGVKYLWGNLPVEQQQNLQAAYEAAGKEYSMENIAEDLKAYTRKGDKALEGFADVEAIKPAFDTMRDTLADSVDAVGSQTALRVSRDALDTLDKAMQRGIRREAARAPAIVRDAALMDTVIKSVDDFKTISEEGASAVMRQAATGIHADLLSENAPDNAAQAFDLYAKALSPVLDKIRKSEKLTDKAAYEKAAGNIVKNGAGLESFAEQSAKLKGAAVKTLENKLVLLAATEQMKQAAANALATKTVEDMAQARMLANLVNSMSYYYENDGTELGRALRLRRLSKKDSQYQEKLRATLASMGGANSTEALLTAIVNATTEAEVKRALEVGTWKKTQDAIVEGVTSGMLFGPATHVVNAMSNGIQIANELFTRAYAEFLGSKVPGGVFRGETYAMLTGIWQGFGNVQKTWKAHRENFQAGKLGAVKAALDAEGMWKNGDLGNILMDEGHMKRAISAERFGLSAEHDRVSGGLATAVDMIGRVLGLPFDLLLHSDQVFKTVAYAMELNAQCVREGKGNAADVAELLEHPPEVLREKAAKFARRVTFQDDLGSIASRVDAIRNELPLARLILPFLKTPVNIYKEGIRMTPFLNKFFGEIRAELNSPDPAVRQLSEAKLMVGTMIWSSALSLAAMGLVTGPGPDDPDKRKRLMAAGWRPNALVINGDHYQIDRLDPLAMLFNTAAFLVEIKDHIQTDDLETAFKMGIGQSLRMLTDRTYMDSFKDAMNLITNFERFSDVFERRLGGMLVPASGLTRTAVRNVDPFQREVDSFTSALKANIPGYSAELPIKRDFLGQPVESLEYAGNNWLSPFQVGRKNDDPVYQEVARLQQSGFSAASMPDRRIARGDFSHKMNGEEYSRFLDLLGNVIKINGRTAKQSMDKLVASDRYKRLGDSEKADALKAVQTAYSRRAKDEMIKKDEKIRRALDIKAKGIDFFLSR